MKLNFDQYGDDINKKPLIIIHGLYGSAANFRGLAKIYAEDFIVFCVDLRNHGNSPHSDEITYSLMADDIIEFMDGRLSVDLLNPLKAIGAAQLQAGNGDHARDAWIRAVHISHVNLGPHNLEQIETLYAIAALYSRAEMSKEERIVRRQIKYLRYRYSAPERQEIVPAMNEKTEGMMPAGGVGSGSE